MRVSHKIHDNWTFYNHDGSVQTVQIPHTWNDHDGQDGGNDYWRGTCVYEKKFSAPVYGPEQRVYLQFDGVNASAKV